MYTFNLSVNRVRVGDLGGHTKAEIYIQTDALALCSLKFPEQYKENGLQQGPSSPHLM